MNRSQYLKIENHPLRTLFRNTVTDSRDLPTVSELRASIEEAVPNADAKTKDALFDAARALAKKAASEGREAWFDLRGEADRYVLGVVEAWEAADQLIPAEDTEPVDVSSVIAGMDTFGEKALRSIGASFDKANLDANTRGQS